MATRAMRAILGELSRRARTTLGDESLGSLWPGVLDTHGPDGALQEVLARWAAADSAPLVLLIDEIDALIGDTLLSVLRQLRAGYDERPEGFPQSVILCGVRDVRDYRIHSSTENAVIAGGSAFNIKAESLRLGDFSPSEVCALLTQHTAETGQPWTEEAQQTVCELTAGQPWLVNALAYEACDRSQTGRDRSRPLTADAIQAARERLILRRDTHLDQLTDKLQEERVRRVIAPLLSGDETPPDIRSDDLQYVRDLGLVARDAPIRVANPIYREVIPRDLTWTTQESLTHAPAWYIDAAGNLGSPSCCRRSRSSFASTPSTGSSGSSTAKRVHSCCCRRSCSASSTAEGGSSASTAWAACAPTCSSSGRSQPQQRSQLQPTGW